jgi:hypothetical protein
MAEGLTRKSFNTIEEANAFIEGVEFIDSDHVSCEDPYEDKDQWVVEITEFS